MRKYISLSSLKSMSTKQMVLGSMVVEIDILLRLEGNKKSKLEGTNSNDKMLYFLI